MRVEVKGVRFGVWGVGSRGSGLGFRVEVSELKVQPSCRKYMRMSARVSNAVYEGQGWRVFRGHTQR